MSKKTDMYILYIYSTKQEHMLQECTETRVGEREKSEKGTELGREGEGEGEREIERERKYQKA